MIIIYWAISQILSYSILNWITFLAIAAVAAYAFRFPGVVLGHIVVAGMIVVLDVQWIQSEILKPGWNGQPDQDFVFMLGVMFRILLINTVLLPVSWLVVRAASKLRAASRLRHGGATDEI